MATIARRLFPERRIPVARGVPRAALWLAASAAELWAAVTGRPPELQRNFLHTFAVKERCDIGKARRELWFAPSRPELVLERAFCRLATKRLGGCDPTSGSR